jgi:outer membrane immunogenic protein
MCLKSLPVFAMALTIPCLAMIAPASAADPEVAPVFADDTQNWEGFYVGVGVSAMGSGIDIGGVGKKGDLDIDASRAGISGIAGYNYMAGNWLLGLEGSISSVGLDKTSAVTGLGNVNIQSDWLATMQLRGGYAFDDLLLYGTAGLALQDLELSSSLGGKYDKTLKGAVFGVGAEYAMSDSWAIRAEALAMTFNDDAKLNGSKRKFDFADGLVRVGITHKF